MNEPMSQKEKLLVMLTDIHDQLEELEMVLEHSFSDMRIELEQREMRKLKIPTLRLSALERQTEKILTEDHLEVDESRELEVQQMKLKLGF